jgi:ATP adenylyltransferase
MDYLWTPWRYHFVSQGAREAGCIFCRATQAGDDSRALIVYRGRKNFIILNLYPYTTGHSMVVPYAHVADLAACDAETLAEMMDLARRLQLAFESLYHPQGYNLGMNLGRAAGAGVADHIHLHVLPRWNGDTNFMTTVAETRLQPEEISITYDRLHRALTETSR